MVGATTCGVLMKTKQGLLPAVIATVAGGRSGRSCSGCRSRCRSPKGVGQPCHVGIHGNQLVDPEVVTRGGEAV